MLEEGGIVTEKATLVQQYIVSLKKDREVNDRPLLFRIICDSSAWITPVRNCVESLKKSRKTHKTQQAALVSVAGSWDGFASCFVRGKRGYNNRKESVYQSNKVVGREVFFGGSKRNFLAALALA